MAKKRENAFFHKLKIINGLLTLLTRCVKLAVLALDAYQGT